MLLRRTARLTVALLLLSACSALSDEMGEAEARYTSARYDAARVWLEHLEVDVAEMDRPMQARFYYLRGMTAYRLGARDDALHYLALARETAGELHRGFREGWDRQLAHALEELTPDTATHHARASGDAAPPQVAPAQDAPAPTQASDGGTRWQLEGP